MRNKNSIHRAVADEKIGNEMAADMEMSNKCV